MPNDHPYHPYTFRGQPISGAHAVALLRAIRLVRAEAQDATNEEIAALAVIAEEFGQNVERYIQKWSS